MPHMVDKIPIIIVNMSITVSSVHAEEIKKEILNETFNEIYI